MIDGRLDQSTLVLLLRSASYRASTGECRLSDMDRHTVAGTGAFTEAVGEEYLENNCVDDPVKLCDFQLLENRIMKTVDSVYQVTVILPPRPNFPSTCGTSCLSLTCLIVQDVPTMEACRDLCLTAPYR